VNADGQLELTDYSVPKLYERMRSAAGEEFELLNLEFDRRCQHDPRSVMRALEQGSFPIG